MLRWCLPVSFPLFAFEKCLVQKYHRVQITFKLLMAKFKLVNGYVQHYYIIK